MSNWKTVHTIALALAAFAAGVPGLEGAFPVSATPWLKGAQGVAILVAAVLGAVSPSAASTPGGP